MYRAPFTLTLSFVSAGSSDSALETKSRNVTWPPFQNANSRASPKTVESDSLEVGAVVFQQGLQIVLKHAEVEHSRSTEDTPSVDVSILSQQSRNHNII